MLPMDPYLGMKIVDQYRQESEQEAEMYRLFRKSGLQASGWVPTVGRRLVGQAGRLLSTVGSWMEQDGIASERPLDGQIGRTA